MATNTVISGVAYKVLTPSNVDYVISPFDINGNLLSKITLAVDTTITATKIYLPEISELQRNWNLTLDIVKTGGGNNSITVFSGGTDKIGSAPSTTINGVGASSVLSPVEDFTWSNLLSY